MRLLLPMVFTFFCGLAAGIVMLGMFRLRRGRILRLLAAFVRRGLPLEDSLADVGAPVSELEPDKLAVQLADKLYAGEPLHSALKSLRILSPAQAAVLKVAEGGGNFAEVLSACSERTIKGERRILSLAAVAAYPVLVGGVLFCISTFVTFFILPKYEMMFRDLSVRGTVLHVAPYPAPLCALLWLWGVLLCSLGLGRWSELVWGRFPVLGTHLRMEAQGRVAHTLGQLLEAGAPLELAIKELNDGRVGGIMHNSLRSIQVRLESGAQVLDSFRAAGGWRPEFLWALEALSQGSPPARTLTQVGEVLESKAQQRFHALYQVLTPLTVVLAAAAVATLVWSIFHSLMLIIEASMP